MRLPAELRDEGHDLQRIRGLSDGIFAFGLTLLVFNLRVPTTPSHPSDSEIWEGLRLFGREFAGIITSFAVVTLLWMAHHRMFRHIRRYDRALLVRNAVLLFFTVSMPYTTQLSTAFPHSALVWTIYSANLSIIGLLLVLIWHGCYDRGQLSESVTPRLYRFLAVRTAVAPAVFIVSMIQGYLQHEPAVFTPLLILPGQVIVQFVFRDRE